MPPRKKTSDQSKLKAGRGQGHGENYKPFLTVRDFGSRGLSVRIKDWRTGRVHHFFSSLEVAYYYILMWCICINDIREQFPLPLDRTVDIANRLNIRHPQINSELVIMTIDFLLDVNIKRRVQQFARTTKYMEELDDFRTLEKFEIERTFCNDVSQTNWGIITELDIPEGLTHNIKWLYPSVYIDDLPQIDVADISYYENALLKTLNQNQTGVSG